jgi:hypothetical protein
MLSTQVKIPQVIRPGFNLIHPFSFCVKVWMMVELCGDNDNLLNL